MTEYWRSVKYDTYQFQFLTQFSLVLMQFVNHIRKDMRHSRINLYGGPQVAPTLMKVQKHLCILRNINASSEILTQAQKH